MANGGAGGKSPPSFSRSRVEGTDAGSHPVIIVPGGLYDLILGQHGRGRVDRPRQRRTPHLA